MLLTAKVLAARIAEWTWVVVKLWSLLGYPKVPYYNRIQKRDHNLTTTHMYTPTSQRLDRAQSFQTGDGLHMKGSYFRQAPRCGGFHKHVNLIPTPIHDPDKIITPYSWALGVPLTLESSHVSLKQNQLLGTHELHDIRCRPHLSAESCMLWIVLLGDCS